MVKPKTEMQRHQATMRELMRSRERREMKRNINRLSIEEVHAELIFNGCSCVGPEATLRERLLRAAMRGAGPGNVEVPWYPWNEAEDVVPEEAAPVVAAREEIEREQATARSGGQEQGVQRAATATSGDDEPRRDDLVQIENVQIHAPPTSTVVVSVPITTTARSAMTTVTMVTPACGTRPTAGVTRTLFAMQHVPNLVLSPKVRAHLNGQGQWEYYSERYVRCVGGVRGGLGLPEPQQRVEQLPQPRVGPIPQPRVERIPQAPRRDARQRWFTPA